MEASFNGVDNYIVYQNIHGDSIKLNYDTKKFSVFIDNEHFIISEVLIGNDKGTFFESQDNRFRNSLIWTTEYGYFHLKSTLKKEEMIKIAENIK